MSFRAGESPRRDRGETDMHSSFRFVDSSLLAMPIALTLLSGPTPEARADDGGVSADAGPNPCGNFDFSGGLNCKIEVSGGCSIQCTPLQFEASCTGQCTATT